MTLNNSLVLRYFEYFLVGLQYNPVALGLVKPMESKGFITCAGKQDGAGAQALAIMSTLLFANQLGLTYVHTPFKKIAHNTKLDKIWEDRWENFFNLGQEELNVEKVNQLDIVEVQKLSKISLKVPNTLYVVNQCHQYANLFPNKYGNIIPSLREKYLSSKENISLPFKKSKEINIAIHIRRGDVKAEGTYSIRYTKNTSLVRTVKQVVQLLASYGLKTRLSLYSQGEINDFGELKNMNISFKLDECPFSTIDELIAADVLIMSKSTFSYVAALLSQGIVMYEDFYHKPLSGWVKINSQSNFSKSFFLAQIREKLV
jgi:hypothetical protein